MVILITGASHTGKTLLAQRMLEQYNYPYLSIDHLKMGLIRSGNTELTPLSDDEALTAYLWPIVREMVKTAIENDQNLIVEGCYIPFDWRRDFDDRYLSSIRFICLAMTEEYIKSHFDAIIRHESDIESRLIKNDFSIDGLIAENQRMIAGFRDAGEQVILIGSDYEQSITEILTSVEN
jgi:2-phosphoglycerate kinase